MEARRIRHAKRRLRCRCTAGWPSPCRARMCRPRGTADEDAEPGGNSREVDPEGVVALLAGVRAIEDLVPEGIGDPAWPGVPVAKHLAARDVQRRVEVPEDPCRYAVGTEPVLKPGHVTYTRATAERPPRCRSAGSQPSRPRADPCLYCLQDRGPATARDDRRHCHRQGGNYPCRHCHAGQPAPCPEPPTPAHDDVQRAFMRIPA